MNAQLQLFEAYPIPDSYHEYNSYAELKEAVFHVVADYMDTPKCRSTQHIKTGLGIRKLYRTTFGILSAVDDNIVMRALNDLATEGRLISQAVVYEGSPVVYWHVSQ